MDDEQLLDLFTDMTRVHTNYVEHHLSPLKLHSGQAAIITALGHNGTCTQKELADFRQVSPATVSVMLGRMERDGLVSRMPSAGGGKANTISLTPAGLALFDRLEAHMENESGKIFFAFTEEEKRAAEKIFLKLAENLRNA